MKAIYLAPLLAFGAFVIAGSAAAGPSDPATLIPFAGFVMGFAVTYVVGVKSTLKNRLAVRNAGASSPYLVPILCFVLPTAGTTSVFIPRDGAVIASFGCACAAALISYAGGMLLVLRDIKKPPPPSQTPAVSATADKRLVLVNPVNPDRIGLSHNLSSRFPPLSLGIIAALTPRRFTVQIVDENMASFRYREADLVGITAFTPSAARAYDIAAQYRARSVPVVLGGIHASMRPEEALHYVDTVVTGEAEEVWPALVEDFLAGKLKRRYTSQPPALVNQPLPRRDLFDHRYLFAPIQTSRGCPMDCAFCSVTAFNGQKRRERPVEEVLDEIARIPNRQLFFVDDNISGNSAASVRRATQLFRGMVERRLDKTWFCQASLHFASDDALLYWARKAGCRVVFLGLESPDPTELKAMNKKVNLRIDYQKALHNIQRHRIAVLGAFINGTPNETQQSLEQKAHYILRHPIDVIQATVMTPLPGTRLFDALETKNKLLYTDFPRDWAKYDMGELTFRLDHLSPEAFMRQHHQCNQRFYSRFNLVKSFLRSLAHTKSIEAAIWAYNSNRNYRSVALHRKT